MPFAEPPSRTSARTRSPHSSETRPDALLIDFGGVLTSSVLDAFDAFAGSIGLPPGALPALLQEDAEANRLFVAFEEGRIGEPDFEPAFAARLEAHFGVEVEPSGLVAGLTSALRPDTAMIEAVRAVRAQGTPVAIVSNSFGHDAYEGYGIDELADELVISADVGVRKPSRHIFRIALERLDVRAEGCVFVDDLELNLGGARRLGIDVFHHREPPATVAFLRRAYEL